MGRIKDFMRTLESKRGIPSTKVPEKTKLPVQGGRTSFPGTDENPWSANLIKGNITKYRIVNRPFLKEIIPAIRHLSMHNADVSQALWNVVNLANTGHKIFFDRNVEDNQVAKMRNYLENTERSWMPGQPGRDGMVNKLFYQLFVGGAISAEAVPKNDLTGIQSVLLVKPEDIDFVLQPDRVNYVPYQRIKNPNPEVLAKNEGMIKMNPNTFRYFGLGGDTEIPYGIPPYMPILEDVITQGMMKKNIRFIVDQMGLIGFLTILLSKPAKASGETNEMYIARLEGILDQTRQNIQAGMKDGIVAGFKDDVEFETNAITKNSTEALELFKNNESQIASGVKQDPSLWGRDYSSSETQMSVVFMKMVSELKNVQNVASSFLEFLYRIDLTLAGFKFDFLTVRFNPSTLHDDYKMQQAQEIKIRNVERKFILGLISQEQMADELGYEASDQAEPRVDINVLAGGKSEEEIQIAKEKREAGKDASDRKVRKDNKPTGGKVGK